MTTPPLTLVGPVPDSADQGLVCHRSPLTHLPAGPSEGTALCASEPGPLRDLSPHQLLHLAGTQLPSWDQWVD